MLSLEERQKIITKIFKSLNANRLDSHDIIDILGDRFTRKSYEELAIISELLYRELNRRLVKCVEEVLEVEISSRKL